VNLESNGAWGAQPVPSPGLTVELVGIPGSGKSRLARTLTAELSGRGLAVSLPQVPFGPGVPVGLRLARKAGAVGAAALSAPRSTAQLTRAVVRSGQPGAADLAGRLVQLLVAQNTAVRSLRLPGVSVLDEGLVQALWSIGIRGNVASLLDGWVPPAPPSAQQLLVVLHTAPEVALERLANRTSQHSRTQLLPERDRLEELKRGVKLLDELAAWWSSRPGAARRVYPLVEDASGNKDVSPLVELICATATSGPLTPS
jgi:hypothetical protein